jgi:hypothetical protein
LDFNTFCTSLRKDVCGGGGESFGVAAATSKPSAKQLAFETMLPFQKRTWSEAIGNALPCFERDDVGR